MNSPDPTCNAAVNALLTELFQELGPQAPPMPLRYDEQRRLLHALLNIREARPVSENFLRHEAVLLHAELEKRGMIDWQSLPSVAESFHPFAQSQRMALWQGDITRLNVDAIVNAANNQLLGCFLPLHMCIDNVIHSAAGVQLRLACHALMLAQGHLEPTGSAQISPAFHLPSRFVLHTVGPVVRGELTPQLEEELASCYTACLAKAVEHKLTSLAFCCISTGEFHFPKARAAEIAVRSTENFLARNDSLEMVIFNVFGQEDLAEYHKVFSNHS